MGSRIHARGFKNISRAIWPKMNFLQVFEHTNQQTDRQTAGQTELRNYYIDDASMLIKMNSSKQITKDDA